MELSAYTRPHLKLHSTFQYEYEILSDVKYELELLKMNVGCCFNERAIARYATRHGLLAPKYMRKVSWRLMIETMPREVVRFIRNRFE